MKKRILITLPKSDDTTEYLTAFSKPIMETCSANGIKVKQLERQEITRTNFEGLIKNMEFDIIVINGHGSPNCITGHKGEKIIEIGVNEQILLGKITYARSCWFALGLEKCVKHSDDKEGCFIGYKIPFEFLVDPEWKSNPQKDNVARIFFDTSNLVPIGLIKGHSTKEVHDNSKRSMLKAINKALSNSDEDSLAIASSLWRNYYGQTIIGNPNLTLI